MAMGKMTVAIPAAVRFAHYLDTSYKLLKNIKLTKTAVLTHSFISIFKTNDWSDSLHNFAVGLGVSISTHLELKTEFADSYKNKPALAALKKNDTSSITALVVKF